MKSLRWRMMTLLMIGSIINFTGAFVGMACQDMSPAPAITLTSTGSSTSSGRSGQNPFGT